MKTNKRKILLAPLFLLALLLSVCIMFIGLCGGNIAFAEDNASVLTLEELCKEYTDTPLLYGEPENGNSIINYESYIESRFLPGKITAQNNKYDEWIFKIVPKQLFDHEVQDYFYLGEEYGFYFDYDTSDGTCFIYLMVHEIDLETSGHFMRKIKPLYYEKYTYNEVVGKAALQYASIPNGVLDFHYYQKYSSIKNVYLKNIAFNGNLYNENHFNAGEQGYVGLEDNGGYFIGGKYMFKGVSTQSGKLEFVAEMFKTIVGYIPLGPTGLTVGDILGVVDTVLAFANNAINASHDFREDITNENDYSFTMIDIERAKQIQVYGTLLKNYYSNLTTPNTKDGVLFGIGGNNYAQNTFYYKFADETKKWNTGFVGKVKIDIVEENGNLFGSTVSPIVTNIESNSYEKNIYGENRLEITENVQKDVYTLAGKICPIHFTAPANGIYTFETFGSVTNDFENAKGKKQTKPDGINKKLIVNLEAGEVFNFSSKNISHSNGIFQIKVEFTPTEIALGETKQLSIKAGETEYVAFYSPDKIGFNYALSATGNYISTVSLNSLNNTISSVSANSKQTNAIATGVVGKYLIGIRNNSANDINIGISISSPSVLAIGSTNNVSLGHNGLYKFTSRLASCPMNFSAVSSAPIQTTLLDENFIMLHTSSVALNSSFATVLEENKKYYLLFNSQNANDVSAQLTVVEAPTALTLGTNSLSKTNESLTYSFTAPTSAEYAFIATENINLTIYNSSWGEITAQNGIFVLAGNSKYYIVAHGETSAFSISVVLNYTESLSGTLSSDGYIFIRFIPSVEDYFDVSDTSNYVWLNNNLNVHSGKLNANQTYFLKISGNANGAYSLSILRRETPIQVRSKLNLSTGLYSINIADAGTYIFTTTKANSVTATFNILNLQRQIIYSSIAIGGEYSAHLNEGVNYLEIICGTNSIGLLLNKLNSDNSSFNTNLLIGIEQNILFNINTDNNFTFTCSSSGEYYFKFAYATLDVIFDITVTDTDLNKVSTTVLSLGMLTNDTLNKRFGVYMDFIENKTYLINVYYNQSNSSVISANVLISIPSIIGDLVLNASDGLDAITAIDDRTSVENVSVIMGKTYALSTPNANKISWQIAASTQAGLCYKSGNNLVVNFNSASEGKTIYINIIDDTAQILTVGILIKFPYYVTANYDLDSSLYSIGIIDRKDVPIVNNGYVQTVKIYMGDEFVIANAPSYSLASYLQNDWNTLRSDVTLKVGENSYIVYSGQITLSKTKVSLNNISGTLQGSGQIIIDARNSTSSNKTITVPTGVTSLVYLGSSTSLNNIKFNFQSNNDFYLYLFGFNTKSTTSESVLNLTQVNNTKIYIGGINSIMGEASTYLINAKTVAFLGDGTLNIIGNNGVNRANATGDGANATDYGATGGNGKDGNGGTNGTNAMYCSAISKTGSGSITLQGGNGGHGGSGTKGGKGGPGNAININTVISGGNGGNGGIGGNGGNAGIGCNIVLSNITTIDGYAGWGGNGGYGGNGNIGINAKKYHGQDGTLFYGNGSNGGNGGIGGNAGFNGSGTLNTSINNSKQYAKGGYGGYGGDGGNGNLSQDNGDIGIAGNGGRGGFGGNGYYGGNGGSGGDGGRGGNGRNGSLFIKVGPGQSGGDGGIGGNGGDSSSSWDNVGAGGNGSNGGAGGNAGVPVLSSNATTSGASGADGDPGTPGFYFNPNSASCIAAGTLITLSNGEQILVELLTGNEMLLVWNMMTGTFDSAPILFIDNDPAREYEVINLYFSDGTIVKIIDEHGFWDFNLNKYVLLRKDAAQYIGHLFNKQIEDPNGNMTWTAVQLVDVDIRTEYTTAWSPVTFGHLCYYVNGMLSMPGGIDGLINIFEVDAEIMQYDQEAMQADIEEYGLFTYEECEEIFPVPEIIFEAFHGEYLKISIGKGLIDFVIIDNLMERYSKFFNLESNTDAENDSKHVS